MALLRAWEQAWRLLREWQQRHKYDHTGYLVVLRRQLAERNDYASAPAPKKVKG